jgi:hypothetical protein
MAGAITLLLTQGMYSGMIGLVSTMMIRTVTSLQTTYTYQNEDVNKCLQELDIIQRIKLISYTMENIGYTFKMDKNNTRKHQDPIYGFMIIEKKTREDPIKLGLDDMAEIIETIEYVVANLSTKLDNHKQKWFRNWRTLLVETELDELRKLSATLDKRFQLLINVATLLKAQ